MKKVLIIRSVSFQQLDKNLAAIEKRFPVSGDRYQLHLLTHSHGIQRAKSYTAIAHIIDYESRKNFTLFHLPPALRKTGKKNNVDGHLDRYEAVVIPVTNQSGAGFLNVSMMARRIPAESIYMCNLTSEMWRISRKRIGFQAVKSCLFSLLAAVVTLPLAVVCLPVLLVSFTLKKYN